MREFFELINEYPWTTFFMCLFISSLFSNFRKHNNMTTIIATLLAFHAFCFTFMVISIITCEKEENNKDNNNLN